jgi:hypothetical protein
VGIAESRHKAEIKEWVERVSVLEVTQANRLQALENDQKESIALNQELERELQSTSEARTYDNIIITPI